MILARYPRFVALLLGFGACLFLVRSAEALPEVKTKDIYYDVTGSTPSEIKDAIRRHSPIWPAWGKFSWVQSTWSVKWSFWTRPERVGCVVSGVDVDIEFENTLPRWTSGLAANEELRMRWRQTQAAMDLYLKQSMSFGMSAAKEIEYLYSRLGTFKSCATLKKAFNKRARHIAKLYENSSKVVAKRVFYGTRQIPDLMTPIGVQVPLPGSSDKEMAGWCEISADLENIEQFECRLKRKCSAETTQCTIDYVWASDGIRIKYDNGAPRLWNDEEAGYAFINASPCVQNLSDKRIFCFFEKRHEYNWYYHLP